MKYDEKFWVDETLWIEHMMLSHELYSFFEMCVMMRFSLIMRLRNEFQPI